MITSIQDVCRFFLGNTEAINKVARTKYIFWISCLFIISAGLARNYDHHILLQEWMWIAAPFGMAFFSSFFIFGIGRCICRIPWAAMESSTTNSANYLGWMRCFLLTAPMAWLYGIPYESFMAVMPATVINFITLIIVSIWRVYLMVMVFKTLFKVNLGTAIGVILIPATVEMTVGGFFKTLNIVGIMGGMRLSPSDEFLVSATNAVILASVILFFVSLIILLSTLKGSKGTLFHEPVEFRPSSSLLISAVLSILIWFGAALYFQPLLYNQKKLRSLMSELLIPDKNHDNLITYLKDKSPNDFPVGHDIFSYRYNSVRIKLSAYDHHKELPEWVTKRLREDLLDLDSEGLISDDLKKDHPLAAKHLQNQ